ncbi:uncharacterized protein LOC132039428 [Lycium ferocissimum]|uniref:uncharacterized protein LOC132039428 n=1 Tax=Lycium ferocissimum TaxID=112874 RepID=UPI002814A4DC|nr:uncharacterized protein LOC132039428 [Lycium ferocissimum]
MECVKTVHYSIIINGEPTPPFDATKGLRQGDPISPFLFSIAMEYLSKGLNSLKNNSGFKHHPRCAKLGITHLSFVDDLILFARGDVESTVALQKRVNTPAVEIWARRNGIQAQLFQIPSKVMKAIEAHCRSYVWSGMNSITKKALVSWDKLCTPKCVGGLNLINLHVWNKAALLKKFWDLAHKQYKMWIKWVHMYYLKNQQPENFTMPKQASWMLRKILATQSTRNELHRPFKTGNSIVRQIYLQLLEYNVRVPWKCLLFKNAARPKAIFTLWLHIQDRLLTKDRLITWDVNIDPKCIFCDAFLETRDHLFVLCPFACSLWTRLFAWLQKII